MRWIGRKLLLGLIGLVASGTATGCAARRSELYGPDDPLVRIPAMKKAVQEKDLRVLAPLVEELGSQDAAVRLFAIESLERLTGQRLGYLYYDSDERRRDAIERWRQWLAEQHGGSPPERLDQPPGSQPATPSSTQPVTLLLDA